MVRRVDTPAESHPSGYTYLDIALGSGRLTVNGT